MKCFKPIFYLKFIHGELSRKEKAKVENHLSACKKCNEIVKKMRREEIELRNLFKEENVDLTSFVLKRVSEVELKRRAKMTLFYFGFFIFLPLIFSIVLIYIRSIPLIGDFISSQFNLPSLFFLILNKILNINFLLLTIEVSIMSIFVFVFLLLKDLRIKLEVLK